MIYESPKTYQRALLIGKSLYFFIYAAIGIFIPFLNVYYREDLQLSGTQIGLLGTLGPMVAIFSGPVWGMLNDWLGRMRLLLGIVTIGAMTSAFVVGQIDTFLLLMIVVAIYNIFASAMIPLVDSFNLTLLGEHRERYSNQRVWGTIGFLFTSTFAGFLFGQIGLSYIFLAYVICLLGFLAALWGLPKIQGEVNRTVFEGFTRMLKQPVWIVFGLAVILVMLANNSWLSFLGITIKQMGGSDALIGAAWSIGAFTELPIMWFGTRLLMRFGARKLVATGFFFYGVRMLLYGLMPIPQWALMISALHSVTFGLYWIGGVNYISEITPPNLRSTGQSMLATFFNIASFIGAPLFGLAFDEVGPRYMFIAAALIAWSGFGVFVLIRPKNQSTYQ